MTLKYSPFSFDSGFEKKKTINLLLLVLSLPCFDISRELTLVVVQTIVVCSVKMTQ